MDKSHIVFNLERGEKLPAVSALALIKCLASSKFYSTQRERPQIYSHSVMNQNVTVWETLLQFYEYHEMIDCCMAWWRNITCFTVATSPVYAKY